MWNSADKCPDCQGVNTGSSPTGAWCNDCGWAEPGHTCGGCGRQEVNEHHLRLPERTLCRVAIDLESLGPGNTGYFIHSDGQVEWVREIRSQITRRRRVGDLNRQPQ